jgi:hypothetical protein
MDGAFISKKSEVIVHLEAGRFHVAELELIKLMIQFPFDVWVLSNLAVCFKQTDRHQAAESCYARAISIEPDNADLLANYANWFIAQDRIFEAIKMFEQAIVLHPNNPRILKNYGSALREAKHFHEAICVFDKVISLDPTDAEAKSAKSILWLSVGDYAKGFELYESRLIDIPDQLKHLVRWQGEELESKLLLVVDEQGFGDTIFASRYVPILSSLGAKVTMACRKPLHRLFAELPAEVIEISAVTQDANWDFYVPMMSLPGLLMNEPRQWPAPARLHISQVSTKKYEFLDHQFSDVLRVGVVWTGSAGFSGHKKRATEFQRFLDLSARFPQVQFFSFQKGPAETDLSRFGTGTIIPLGNWLTDFEDTAAAIQYMDIILMTDSSYAHLAASIGVPVINLLSFAPFWLYLPETPKSSLYRSMRFLRQETSGDWSGVFECLQQFLACLIQSRSVLESTADDILDQFDSLFAI